MHTPCFEIDPINLDSYAMNDRGKTVAVVTPQGYVDWLKREPAHRVERLTAIRKEPHLGWVLGTKFNLHFCHLTEPMDGIGFETFDNNERLLITGRSHSRDNAFEAVHRAVLSLDEVTGRYRWELKAVLRNVSGREVPMGDGFVEYTNVYPAGCGRCMLFAPEKRFDRTLLLDADNAVWEFPHQHFMHYGHKLKPLRFSRGTVGGFFGEDLNPVVLVHDSTLPPDWAICDMYYDLHCGLRTEEPIAADAVHAVRCSILYWDREEAKPLERKAKRIPVNAEDYRKWSAPRLDLGRNDFTDCPHIDDVDDCSGFRQNPPVKVWDRETGPEGKGSLRITNETPAETVWSAEPPTQIPASRRFRLAGLAKVKGVKGKGFFLRVRYHTFEWRPEPHVEWLCTLESDPVMGDTGDEWVHVETPELKVPAKHKDFLIWIDVVLDGEGTAWLTDMEVDLRSLEEDAPVAPSDSPTRGKKPAAH